MHLCHQSAFGQISIRFLEVAVVVLDILYSFGRHGAHDLARAILHGEMRGQFELTVHQQVITALAAWPALLQMNTMINALWIL